MTSFIIRICGRCGAQQHRPASFCRECGAAEVSAPIEVVPAERVREAERLLAGALAPGAMGRPVRCFSRGEMADIEMALAVLGGGAW